VGVKVEVGRGVFVGVELGVVVGNKIGVMAAAGVGEGAGGAVEVGIVVGVRETISDAPRQAMRKKAVPDKSNKNFLVIATYLALSGGRSPKTKREQTVVSPFKGILQIWREIASPTARNDRDWVL
jgi:hypothetical protein